MEVERKENKKLLGEKEISALIEDIRKHFKVLNDYVVIVWDSEGTILEFKESNEGLLGYSAEQLEGKNWLNVLIDYKEREEMEWVYRKLVSGELVRYYVNPIKDINGVKKTFLWYNFKLESTEDDKQIFFSIGFCLESFEMLSRRVERYRENLGILTAERENLKFKILKQDSILKQKDEMIKGYKDKIEFLAFYDELTKLPNKNSLVRWLNLRLTQPEKSNAYLIFLEVRNLEKLNVMYGYDLVDQLIIHISERVKNIVGDHREVFKIGFDKFAIIYKTNNISEFIDYLMSKLSPPYNVNGSLIKVNFNIGAHSIDEGEESSMTLIRKCDLALIKAKEKGLNKYEIFKPSLEIETLKEGIIEKEIRNALDLNEFLVFYQPIVRLEDGKISGMEALLRWHYLKSVFISPLEFIPVAEKCGLIIELGDIVLKDSIKLAKLLNKYRNEFVISLNISPVQFSESEFTKRIVQMIEDEKLDNVRLQFEITEKLAVENIDYTIEVIKMLEKYNIIFVLDDFGVDYSSLNYLRKLPVKGVKIDKSFVEDIKTDETYFIVETIVKLCKKLNLKVTVEGIETAEQYEIVKELGCDYVQGYFVSKPLPINELLDIIEKYNNKKIDKLSGIC